MASPTTDIEEHVEDSLGAPSASTREPAPPYRLADLDRSGKVVVVLLVVLMAIPWAHSIWQAEVQDYRVTGDHALISLRAFDVFAGDPPLIGQPSTAELYSETNKPAHPGPIEFYFLSVPQRLLGPHHGAYLGATSFSLGAVLVAAWVVFRRGGPAVGLLGACVVSFIAYAEGPAVLFDILSSNVGGIPLLGLAALAWAVLDGDIRLLPLAALSFSFVTQQHLAIFGMAMGMGVWIAVGLTRYLLRWRWRARLPDSAGVLASAPVEMDAAAPVWGRFRWSAWLARTIGVPGSPSDRPLPWILGALAVGFVAWLPVLIDAVVNDGGNLRKIAGFGGESDRATLGLAAGLTQMLRSVGVPPLLARKDLVGIDMYADLGPAAVAAGVVVLGLLAAVAVVFWRRRPSLATLALTALALAAVGVVNGSQVPDSYEATRINFYRWMYVSSILTWITLLWTVGVLVAERSATASAVPRRVAMGATVAVVALVAFSSSAGRDPVKERDERFLTVANGAAATVPDAVPGEGKRILLLTDGRGAWLGLGPVLGLDLERQGHDILVPPDQAAAYGDHRVLHPEDDIDLTLMVAGGSGAPAAGPGTEVFRGDMNADRRAVIDELVAQAEGQPVEISPDADAILRRAGFEGDAADLALAGFSRLAHDPRAVLSSPAALHLIDEGLLVSPRFDPATVDRALALPEPHSIWNDDVYAVRVLTPEQTAEAYPDVLAPR